MHSIKKQLQMKKIYFFTLLILFATSNLNSQEFKIQNIIDSIGNVYVPDKRISIYSVSPKISGKGVILKGKISDQIAHNELINSIKRNRIVFLDSIQLLPENSIGEKHWSIIPLSAIYIRKKPSFDSELITQALMGTIVRVLDKHHGWYCIQTPDRYIGWANVSLPLYNLSELRSKNQSDKVIVLENHALVYESPNTQSDLISEVILGDILFLNEETTVNSFYHVSFSDGSKGFIVASSVKKLNDWQKSIRLTGENIVESAKKFMGLPYLWGGASSRGVDCSGFAKTIYFMYGIILPRDASQQFYSGEKVDISKGYDLLQKGDLLFFGEKSSTVPEKFHVVHVGIYIGNKQFIHSSEKVKISSFDPQSPKFDSYNTKRLIGAKRIIGTKESNYWNYFTHEWNL